MSSRSCSSESWSEVLALADELQDQRLEREQVIRDERAVPLETVKQTRRHRDLGWDIIRRQYIEENPVEATMLEEFGAADDVPGAFERAVKLKELSSKEEAHLEEHHRLQQEWESLIRVPNERRSPCHSIGPEHRETLYPVFQRWFGIPYPSAKDRAILPSSQLSSNVDRDASRRQEAQRLRPHSDLLSIPPALSAELSRKKMHQIAFEMGESMLQAARKKRQRLSPAEQRKELRERLRPILGDIEPTPSPHTTTTWKRPIGTAVAEAISVTVEDGIQVPTLLLHPAKGEVAGVVVAVSGSGKDRFLASRATELAALLGAGFTVCLPDVRGTGETAMSRNAGDSDNSLTIREFDLSGSLLGSRLRDLRTVLSCLRSRSDLVAGHIALWGESFTPPNAENLYLDELDFEAGPQIQRGAEPLGAHLVLLAALYEDEVRAVAARGGLAGYLTVLVDSFTYTPMDVILWGVLNVGDIADIAAALSPRPLSLEGLVNGRNSRVNEIELNKAFRIAGEAYGDQKTLRLSSEYGQVAKWLMEHSN